MTVACRIIDPHWIIYSTCCTTCHDV